MPRPTIASLSLLLAACAAPARTPAQPANAVPTAQYSLLPLSVRGSEGMHSASHSSTTIGGVLSITGERAELVLDLDTFVGFVRCPEEMQTGKVHTMQACAPEGAKDTRTASKRVMRGSARTENGALVVSVAGEEDARDRRIEPHRISLACRDSFLGLSCSITETNLFGVGVIEPHTMAFLTPGTKRFAIAPATVKDVGLVGGSLALDAGGRISLALSVDGGEPTTLPGSASWMDHGISLQAQTAPTRNLSALCTLDGDALACEVTGDRSILGKPEHIYSTLRFVPEREGVPAQAPAQAPMQAPMNAAARG